MGSAGIGNTMVETIIIYLENSVCLISIIVKFVDRLATIFMPSFKLLMGLSKNGLT